MANKSNRHEMQSVGGRLRYFREKAGYTQQRLAEEIHTTRQLVALWEKNERNSYTPYIDDICKTLHIDEGTLLNGILVENQTVFDDLGLTNDSIEYLKRINNNRNITLLDSQYYSNFAETASSEGISNLLILKTLNLILSTNCGQSLLQAIGNYCFTDFEKGYPAFDEEIFIDSSGQPIQADSIKFNVIGVQERCVITLDLMKFALLNAIENEIETLRANVKGDFE